MNTRRWKPATRNFFTASEERPPEVTFDLVNVGGTRHLLAEAERAGVRRFVFVSSLGADRGGSPYHASKCAAEDLVRQFPGEWLICRPGNVYGPGDEVISFLLQVVRTSPAVPVISAGDQPFQPIYAEEVGAALARAVARRDLSGQVLLLAGPEVTTTQDVLDRLARLTGRDPVRVPVPATLASLGAQAASRLGINLLPVDENKIAMLLEGNAVPPGEVNALTDVLGIQPTPLEEGLRRLANEQPEQLPDDVTGSAGPLMLRRYAARLHGVRRPAAELFAEFRRRFFELLPESTVREAGEPVGEVRLVPGATLTLVLPLRGHVQIRVVEVTNTSMTLVTLAGHPLAGANSFRFAGAPGEDLRFEVETCDRPANPVDGLAMLPGTALKHATWNRLVERTATAFGALPPIEVAMEERELEGEEERQAEREIQRKVEALARREEPALQDEARQRLAGEWVGRR